MNLRKVVDLIDRETNATCILAKRPWGPESQAALVRLTDEYRVPDEAIKQGYEYFLEVAVALNDVLGGVEDVLTPSQRFEAVLFYAENDAYPSWLCTLRDRLNEDSPNP